MTGDSVTDSVTGDSVTGDSVTGDSVTGDAGPDAGLPGQALARQVVPVTLIDSTVRGSLGFATKQATATSLASTTATALARGVLHTMMISKLKVLGVVALAGALGVGGARALARHFGAVSAGPQPATTAATANDRQTALLRSVDKIDRLLDDEVRGNRDLQTELRALSKEIAALPSADSKAAATGRSVSAPEPRAVEAQSSESPEKPSERAKLSGQTLTGHEKGGMLGGPIDQQLTHYRNNQY